MPPEPWDQELGVKDRCGERGAGYDAVGGSTSGGGRGASSSPFRPRKRDWHHFARGGDFPRSSPRRSPPRHYAKGGGGGGYYQPYPDEPGSRRRYTPARSDDRFHQEDEAYLRGRSCGSESRGRSPGGFSRPRHEPLPGGFSQQRHEPLPGSFSRQRREQLTGPRSVAVPVSPVPSRTPLRDRRIEDGWKPLNWVRSSSLSSSKALVEELGRTGKETPARSPVTSSPNSDDGATRKKQRLSWGQGLAKFEKKKVDGSVDVAEQCPNSTKPSPEERSSKLTVDVAGCESTAAICSSGSSSSPVAVEDKPCFNGKVNDTNLPGNSPACRLPNGLEECFKKLYPLAADNMDTLTSLLTDLLQHEDAHHNDSSFTTKAIMSNLLVLKGELTKEVEKTECEIDLLENEIKSLSKDGKNDLLRSSIACQADCTPDCLGLADAASKLLNSTPSNDNALLSAVTQSGESSEVNILNGDNPVTGAAKQDKSSTSSSVRENSDYSTPKLTACPRDDTERSLIVGSHEDENSLDAVTTSSLSDYETSTNDKKKRNFIDIIMDSNRRAAKKASQVFDKALSTVPPQFDMWRSDHIKSCRKNEQYVREKLAAQKHLLKFKEHALTLKFRALHHLWKEELRLLSIKKHSPKSQKRFESSSYTGQRGSRRHRSSFHAHNFHAGNLAMVQTTELADFASKLLSGAQITLRRNTLKMPDLILDKMERKYTTFVSNNGLIEDPQTYERERALLNPWAHEEKEIFMEMLATFGKDFAKVSSFLTHKTTADCIEFYYKNHKSDSFKDVKQQLKLRKQQQCLPTSNYLGISGNKWNRGVNVVSLDMLGEASVLAANSNGITRREDAFAGKSISGSLHDLNGSHGDGISLERPNNIEISMNEKETAAADVLAGICGTVSSEAMSYSVTDSVNHAGKMKYGDWPLTSEVTQRIDEDTCSDDDHGKVELVDWTDEEKSEFIRALHLYGKDFARISCIVGSRSEEQCKIFFSKARKCLGLDMIQPKPCIGGSPKHDTSGGRSNTAGACAPKTNSAICSTQSSSKLDLDSTQSMSSTESTDDDVFVTAGNICMHPETDGSCEQYRVGGSNHVEAKGKVGRLAPVHSEEKLATEGGHSRCDKILNENKNATFICNEPAPLHEVTVSTDRKTGAVELEDTGGNFHVDGLRNKVDLHHIVTPEAGNVNQLQENIEDADDNASLLSATFLRNENDSSRGTKKNEPDGLTCFPDQTQNIRLRQKSATTLSLNKVLPNPSICYEDLQLVASQSIHQGNWRRQNSAPRNFYQERIVGNQSLKEEQTLHTPRGYPLKVLNMEMEHEADCTGENPVSLGNSSNENGITRQVPDPQSQILYPATSENQSKVHQEPCFQNSCGETNKQSRQTGDVKLFGQILIPSSSLQKLNSSLQESDNLRMFPKQNILDNIKLSDGRVPSRPESNGCPGSMELPLTNGFWDGNKMQSGCTLLPESTSQPTKYHHSISEASSAKDSILSTNGVLTDLQQVYAQSLATEEKRLADFPELQKRNGLETVRGLQHQGQCSV